MAMASGTMSGLDLHQVGDFEIHSNLTKPTRSILVLRLSLIPLLVLIYLQKRVGYRLADAVGAQIQTLTHMQAPPTSCQRGQAHQWDLGKTPLLPSLYAI